MSSQSEQEPLTPMSLRDRAGLSQMQVAVALGRTPTTVSNWERGVKHPEFTLLELQRLIGLYQCSFEEFLEAFGPAINVKVTLHQIGLILDYTDDSLDELIGIITSIDDLRSNRVDPFS